jgi:hypothetical protein
VPSGGVILICAAIGLVFYAGDKVAHWKPIQKTNHVVCRVATVGQRCKAKGAHDGNRSTGTESTADHQ